MHGDIDAVSSMVISKRVRAKLLFLEGKTNEAIDSIAHSENPKTVSLWLAILIDTRRFEKAYEYISKNSKQNPVWVCEAISVFIETGRIQEADDLLTVKFATDLCNRSRGELVANKAASQHVSFYRCCRCAFSG